MEKDINKQRTICFVAGKSGGHIIPCLTLAQRYKEKDTNLHILFFSSNHTLDKKLVNNNQTIHTAIVLELAKNRAWYRLPLLALSLGIACAKSMYYLSKYKPERVISTGGIVAAPVCVAAWFLRIPIDLYELNAMPGKAIQYLAPLATTVHVCFAETEKYFTSRQCVHTQYPIRYIQQRDHRTKALPQFCNKRITLFVQGGSQGSQLINNQIKTVIEHNPDICHNVQIIHQTGSTSDIDWHDFYRQHHVPAHVFDYDHNIEAYYGVADLVICRSGAGTLFEIVFFKKDCITIPLETKTNNHQLHNARAIVAAYPQQFAMIRQNETISYQLALKIRRLFRRPA